MYFFFNIRVQDNEMCVSVIINKKLKYVALPTVLFALIKADLIVLLSEVPLDAKSMFLLLESYLLISYSFFIISIDP